MLRYLEDVVTLQLDVGICNGCGMCINVCPHGVFSVEHGKAAIADRGACIECGACAINCPVNAIRVQTGAGCAAGLIRAAIGKGDCCASPCGVSPAGTGPTGTGCCGAPAKESQNADTGKPSCCSGAVAWDGS